MRLIAKPVSLIDRDQEWAACAGMWNASRPDLYIVRGRRRAGKSFLLSRFASATANGMYFQATKQTEREQLAALTRVVARHFQDPALERVSFGAWEDLFHYCLRRVGGEPFLLVLDEFPCLASAAPALPSIIQSIWDHRLPDTRFKLVLSGSHITAMKRLTEADQPLFGRRTGLIQVNPFGYRHAAEFGPDYSPRDRIRMYGIFGGLPGHLALIDPSASLVENVGSILLSSTGRLHEEATHVFDAFVANAEVHNSIVEAIANGERRWSRIANRIGKSSASLSRPLEWLREMEVVEQAAPLTGYPKPSPKSMVYRLRDPYLRFWYNFVSELRAQGFLGLLSADELWHTFVAPRLDSYIGQHVFEDVCRQFVAGSRHPRIPLRPARVGSWWTEDASEEVDVVATDAAGAVLVGECKWGVVNREDLVKLERRAGLIASELGSVREVRLALFSAAGVADTYVQSRIDAGEVLHFTLDDLFA